MLQGLKALADDPSTSVIVLISKPPSSEVAERVLQVAGEAGKPVVVNFLGADPEGIRRPNVFAAGTLEDAAAAAVALADGRAPEESRPKRPPVTMPPSWPPGSDTFAVYTVGGHFVMRPHCC